MTNQLDKLQDEVDFWKTVVDGYRGSKQSPEYHRMSTALKLAKYLYTTACSARISTGQKK